MNNINYKKLYDKLIEDINSSNLPVGGVYFILKNIFEELERLYEDTVKEELNKKDSVTVESEEIPIVQLDNGEEQK